MIRSAHLKQTIDSNVRRTVVIGTVALDTVETPFGKVQDVLGGSATYFAYSASFFSGVDLAACVGEDFPRSQLAIFEKRPVCLDGLTTLPGKTFRWSGRYTYDLNEAQTLQTQLNVLTEYAPQLPQAYRDDAFLFLANLDPEIQMAARAQMRHPRLVACDSMNFWIEHKRDKVEEAFGACHLVVLNDAEARELARTPNLVGAAKKISALGPATVIIKKGEHGALAYHDGDFFHAPAYPLENVFDPTGCGDCFGGGVMGYLASQPEVDAASVRRACIYGSVIASFNAEDFSLRRLLSLTRDEIERRYQEFQKLVSF